MYWYGVAILSFAIIGMFLICLVLWLMFRRQTFWGNQNRLIMAWEALRRAEYLGREIPHWLEKIYNISNEQTGSELSQEVHDFPPDLRQAYERVFLLFQVHAAGWYFRPEKYVDSTQDLLEEARRLESLNPRLQERHGQLLAQKEGREKEFAMILSMPDRPKNRVPEI